MSRMLLSALAALVALAAQHAPAAAAPAHDAAVWAGAFAAPELGDGPARGWLDLHARRGSSSFVGMIRPGVGVRLSDAASAWTGVAWIGTFADEASATHELRVWQQGILTSKAGGAAWMGRLRLEQRLRDPKAIGWRVRAFGRVGGTGGAEGRASLVAWDELFVGLNATGWGAVRGIDQNRLFVGAALPLETGGRVEIGALSVAAPRDQLQLTWGVAVNAFAGKRPRDR